MKFAVILRVDNGRPPSFAVQELVSDPTPIRVNARMATVMRSLKLAGQHASEVVSVVVDTDEAIQ